MKTAQIDLVQASFKRVVPIADQAAEIFYARLFEIAPEVKPFFKGDMKAQGQKLMTTLGVVVNGLRNLDSILPAARNLAIGHVNYGVEAAHYQPVGEALIYTLEQGLGDDFDDDTKAAWLQAYALLSGFMIESAYGTVEAAE
ncbi:MAG: globin family protein [Hyphomicrobiales bacterium]